MCGNAQKEPFSEAELAAFRRLRAFYQHPMRDLYALLASVGKPLAEIERELPE